MLLKPRLSMSVGCLQVFSVSQETQGQGRRGKAWRGGTEELQGSSDVDDPWKKLGTERGHTGMAEGRSRCFKDKK